MLETPSGDLGAKRTKQLKKAFPRPIKRSGEADPNPLTYRKPASANQYGGTSGGHA